MSELQHQINNESLMIASGCLHELENSEAIQYDKYR